MKPADHEYVLGLHLNQRGLGWIAFTGPFSPHDWGNVSGERSDRPTMILRRCMRLVDRFNPSMVVLESFEDRQDLSDEHKRIYRAIIAALAEHAVDCAIYPRSSIVACFRDVGAATRQEIAEAIGRHLPILREQVPPARRAWESPLHHRMGVFCAAAAVLSYYRLSSERLLNDLAGQS